MTDTPLDHVRATALLLPEVGEVIGDVPTFDVAGGPFAMVDGLALHLLVDADPETFTTIQLSDDVDWPEIEDRLARAWEIAAPARLLEAGGR